MAPVSKGLRDERAAKLKTMTPAKRKQQVIAWGKEFDQGKTPSGPSAGYKPTPLKPSSGRKPFASLKSRGKPSYVSGTSMKDPRQQAIENLIRYRDRDSPKPTRQVPQTPTATPNDYVPVMPQLVHGVPGYLSSATNPTGVGFANVAPGELTGFQKYLASKGRAG